VETIYKFSYYSISVLYHNQKWVISQIG